MKTSHSHDGYPAVYKAVRDTPSVTFPKVFDPALKQFANGFRRAQPQFCDENERATWMAAQVSVIHGLLGVLASSNLKENLVLRGSASMNIWFPELARIPGDVDFVVQPESIQFAQADDLLDRFVDVIGNATVEGVQFDFGNSAVDEIWTYDRAKGKRLVVPWVAGNVPGFAQFDFTFEDSLEREPIEVQVPGIEHAILVAHPWLQVAWKLLWLSSDSYPMAKDLFDFVLLATQFGIDWELVESVYSASGDPFTEDFIRPGSSNYWEELDGCVDTADNISGDELRDLVTRAKALTHST